LHKYVPYSSLTQSACLKASRGEEDFIINARGGLTARGLDRRDERTIAFTEWLGAAHAAEERVRFHHGEPRAAALEKHHRIVTELVRSHSWPTAAEYDVRQRELAALHPEHDLASLDDKCLTLISTALLLSQQSTETINSGVARRPQTESFIGNSPRKCFCSSGMCFRCVFAGHMPADCKAETTTAGRPVCSVIPDPSGRNRVLLIGPNNKPFCIMWAKDSLCSFDKCRNLHICTLCGNTSHGATQCKPLSH
jgi:hypothetical protein